MAKRRPTIPPLTEADREALDDYLELAAAPWAGHLMRTTTRRTWLAPLIAVPIAQLVESAIPPSLDPLDARRRNTAGKLSRGVMAALNRLTTDRTTPLTDDDARCIICLADFHGDLPAELLSSKAAAAELLGIPTDLAGEALVRQVARAIDDHRAPPAWLALLADVLLDDFSNAKEPKDLLPAPHSFFAPVVQALDRRCHGLGFKNWGDALEHSSQVWTAERWRELLVSFAAGAAQNRQPAKDKAKVPSRPTKPGPGAGRRYEREIARLTLELRAVRREAEQTRTAAAATRLREAELIQARDRALARVAELARRLETAERERTALRAELEAQEARLPKIVRPEPEPAVPPPAPPPPLDPLRDRVVFLFTGADRGVAVQAQTAALRGLGAVDVRVYDLGHGRPGPDLFPAGSVVVVDIRFAGHSQTEEIEARARRSERVTFVQLQAGGGGLAAKLVERLG